MDYGPAQDVAVFRSCERLLESSQFDCMRSPVCKAGDG